MLSGSLETTVVLRRMRRRPIALVIAGAMIAGAIGTSSVILDIYGRVILQPPPGVSAPQRIYHVGQLNGGAAVTRFFSYGQVLGFEDRGAAAGLVAAYTPRDTVTVVFGQGANRRTMPGIAVSYVVGNYFEALGVPAQRGRLDLAADASGPGHGPSVVVSERFWRALVQRGYDEGRDYLLIGGKIFAVAGVASNGFAGLDVTPADMWISARWMGGDGAPDEGFYFKPFVRLKGGIGRAEAAHLLADPILRTSRLAQGVLTLRNLAEARWADQGLQASIGALMLALSAVLFLIACANISGILVTRSLESGRDLAIQRALGAPSWRLAFQPLMEAVTIVGLSGLIGVGMASQLRGDAYAVLFPAAVAPSGMTSYDVGLAALLLIVASTICCIVPAIQILRFRMDVMGGARTATPTSRHTVWQRLVLATQMLAVFVLISVGTVLLLSLRRAIGTDIGVDATNLAFATLSDSTAASTRAFRIDAQRTPLALASDLAGDSRSASAAIASALSLRSRQVERVRVPGLTTIHQAGIGGPYVSAVTPGYFAAIGTRLTEGRGFDATDRVGTQLVAIVNRTMRKELWRGHDPLGKCLYVEVPARCYRVIGVADDAPGGALRDMPAMQYYVAVLQRPDLLQEPVLLVRGRRSAVEAAQVLRTYLVRRYGLVPNAKIATYSDLLAPEVRPLMASLAGVSLVGVVALLLAAGGLYSANAFQVARRQREFAVRAALGASLSAIWRMMLRETLGTLVITVLVGIAVSAIGARFLEPILFRTKPLNWVGIGVASVVIVLVSVGCTVIPVQKMRTVDLQRLLSSDAV